MSQHHTQCPHCHTTYPLPEAVLSKPNTKATCKKCNQAFVVNAHIVSKNDKPQSISIVIGANDLASGKADDFALPKIPIRQKKRQTTPITEGMIHDDMASDEPADSVDFGTDIEDFLNTPTEHTPSPVTLSSSDNNRIEHNEDEWATNLLQDNKPQVEQQLVKQSPKDDLSDIIGVDLDSVIPAAEPVVAPVTAPAPHRPTQEQLAKQRSLGYYVVWGLGCLALIGLLLAQYVYFNRYNIAKNPEQARMVGDICPNCLPAANPASLHTDYTLKAGMADFTTDLTASITNLSNTPQLYPNLKITVLGKTGVIGTIVVAPKDYLAVEQHTLGAEQTGRFMLTLDVARSDVASVTLEPFY